MATDPVCGMHVREDEHALTADRDGRRYYFCSKDCRLEFLAPATEIRRLRRQSFFALGVSAVVLALMYLPLTDYEAPGDRAMEVRDWIMLVLATPVQWWAGARFYRGLWHAVRARAANMDALIAIGTGAAFVFSAFVTFRPHVFGHETYFDVSTVVIGFVLVGRLLENSLKERATQAVRRLMDLRPARVTRLREGMEEEIPVEQLVPGDRFRVRPGERVATDGRIVEGTAAMDESMITGESVPVTKGVGDEVVGGTINTSGLLWVEATRVGRDTTIAQIADLVSAAQSGRAPMQRLVDRVSEVFVPVVLIVAVLTFLFWWWGMRASVGDALLPMVAVLVIACPCAMGLATPAALLAAVGSGAERGILVKDTRQFEALAKADTVLFDKTGTLTTGTLTVTHVLPAAGFLDADVLRAASAVEAGTTHPIGRAIVAHVRSLGLEAQPVEEFREEAGEGVEGVVEGRRVRVGALEWVAEESTELAWERDRLRGEGRTVVGVAVDGGCIGLLALSDEPKAGALEAIQALQRRSIQVRVVTGDNLRTAEGIARRLGITRIHARQRPNEKALLVAQLRQEGRVVAFVGDGINDAPSLAEADVGIALGAGTDVARETGGIVLLKNDPRDVENARVLARRAFFKVRQNLFWAFVYNVALIPVAAINLLDPILAGAAMALSSVTVMGNSLLLRARRPPLGAVATPLRPSHGSEEMVRAPRESLDPVCGMIVDPRSSPWRTEGPGGTVWFCSAACLEAYRTEPGKYQDVSARN